MSAKDIIEKFGGQSSLASIIGKGQSTVAYWAKTGVIPAKWQRILLDKAVEKSIDLSPNEFMPITKNTLPISMLPSVTAKKSITHHQGDLFIDKQREIDGVGMGVLSDGTAFLTGRGLARLCGISNPRIVELGQFWDSESPNALTAGVKKILESRGVSVPNPYIEVVQRSGIFHAYSDVVCLAVLEYYAFEQPVEEAKKNFRILAGKALHDFIYAQVGYDPNSNIPDQWKQFHDRVSLTYNSVPAGYFGIFKEIADMIVTLGQAGIHIDDKFVPDISVGIAWAAHWKNSEMDSTYGERIKFQHNYPSYFPQSSSNPQEPWCYPESALGEFRKWFRDSYIGEGKFAKYINGKVKDNLLPVSFAQLALSAYERG